MIIQRSDPLTFFGRAARCSVCPPGPLGDGTLSVALADRATPARRRVDLRAACCPATPSASPRTRACTRSSASPSLRVSAPPTAARSALEVDGTYVGERTDGRRYGVAPGSLLVAGAVS